MNEQTKPLENQKKKFNLKHMCESLGKNTRKKGRLAKPTPALVPQPKGAVQERGGGLALALEQAKRPDRSDTLAIGQGGPRSQGGRQSLGLQVGVNAASKKSMELKEKQAAHTAVLALHAANSKEIAKAQVKKNSM